MRRRALLTAMATTVAGAAGCIGDDASPAGDGSMTDTDTATDTPGNTATTEDPPSTTVVSEGPTPPPATDVFADFECPSFEDTDRTVCYHEAAPADVPLVLTAQPELFDPYMGDDNVEALDFTLYNRSEWSVGFNPYDWGIERYDDGEWTHVAPEMYPEPWTRLPARDTFRWSLPSEPHQAPSDDQIHQVDVALDAGVYAFRVSVSYERHETAVEDGRPDGKTELIALFRIEQAIGTESDENGMSTETGT